MLFALLFGFIAGAASLFVFHKSNLKKLSGQLLKKVDELNTGTIKKNDETIPSEFSQVVSNLETFVNKQKEETKPIKSNSDANDKSISLQKLIDNLYIVNELGQNVTSSLNLQQSFEHLYSTINSMMDAAVIELSVYNEALKEFKVITNLEIVSDANDSGYTNHIAAWCLSNKREVFLADAEMDYGRYVFQPLVLPNGRMAKSVIAFPIMNNGIVSGTLCVMSFKKNSFDEYHCEIIRLLLGYISVAIRNAITHEELNLTKVRAEQSEKFKEQFLANMSHEIRTPINAVTGMTRLLLEREPRPEQLRYLESIRNASDSLLVIINDILDLSKIEAGKVELEKIDFSVHDVVQQVKDIMHFKAEEKGLSLRDEVEGIIAPVLVGDPTRLTQILINLVGNAIKFTDKGSVEIKVAGKKAFTGGDSQNSDSHLQFSIRDTGIGMTPEQQQKLFQNYTQASTDTSRKYGGTGLGLSISKQLVQLQGGSIEVESKPGAGSVFSFSISFPVSKNKSVARKEKSVSKEMLEQLKGIKVLLADDNEYNRIVARETMELKIEDVIVEDALDGAIAVEMVRKNEYDLVLMDLVMPTLNGLEAAQKIRNELAHPKNQIPILALTASVVKSEMDKCFAAGMNGFIPKPFKTHELIAAIYNALHSENPATFEEIIMTDKKHNSSSAMQVDLGYLKEFTEGDQVRLQRYLELFLSKIPVSISALKMALENNDLEKIRITSHSMKPQLRFTGVMRGLELAESIEQICNDKNDIHNLPDLVKELEGVCEMAVTEIQALVTIK